MKSGPEATIDRGRQPQGAWYFGLLWRWKPDPGSSRDAGQSGQIASQTSFVALACRSA
jgi:hypothetical protein